MSLAENAAPFPFLAANRFFTLGQFCCVISVDSVWFSDDANLLVAPSDFIFSLLEPRSTKCKLFFARWSSFLVQECLYVGVLNLCSLVKPYTLIHPPLHLYVCAK